jgi:shikimate kinase
MAVRPFVLALSGIPGAGKTTLTQAFRQRFGQIQVIYYDHFQTITQMTHAQVNDWFARGADPNEFDLARLVSELSRQTQPVESAERRPLLLFETPFGRLHRTTGAFIDFLVWVDTPLDVALARATLAFLNIAQRDRSPAAAGEFIKWQTQYMKNYPVIRPMYVAQREAISTSADLILDGAKPPDESVALIVAAIAERGIVV